MEITVSVQLDGSSATYEVKHEVDGIYKAILINKDYQSYQFPEKIILIRSDGSWSSDCPNKIVGLKIGQKINER